MLSETLRQRLERDGFAAVAELVEGAGDSALPVAPMATVAWSRMVTIGWNG